MGVTPPLPHDLSTVLCQCGGGYTHGVQCGSGPDGGVSHCVLVNPSDGMLPTSLVVPHAVGETELDVGPLGIRLYSMWCVEALLR